MRCILNGLKIAILSSITFCQSANAVPVTLFHTNDLHSHFRSEKTPLELGGVARLKTALDQARKQTPASLLVDGGDWSEGTIYYTDGAGAAVLSMLDQLGYDVAVIGNHDWLNGPDTILKEIEMAKPKVSLISANFDASKYPRQSEFEKSVAPYVIKEVNGVKIAFVGLATYEFIYNQFISPIEIKDPITVTKALVPQLRKIADAVVVISHNRISYNERLLREVPEIDLVIGAHDHVKLTEPVVVKRKGYADGWVVEAGCWGKYFGRVDLDITPSSDAKTDPVQLLNYGLTQIDRMTPEDPRTLQKIASIEAQIETKLGPVFHDEVATSEIELYRSGSESLMGDFITESYRRATGAEIGVDIEAFIYGGLHAGSISSSDVYSADPAVYNPQTGKSWDIQTLSMKGSIISRLFQTFFSKAGGFDSTLYMAGVTMLMPLKATSVVENPDFSLFFQAPANKKPDPDNDGSGVVVLVDGNPINPDRDYSVVTGDGLIQTLKFIDSKIDNWIPTGSVVDTGLEGWRVLADDLRQQSPIQMSKLNPDSTIKTPLAATRILYDDVSWKPISKKGQTVHAQVSVRVTNVGGSPSAASGNEITFSKNQYGNNGAVTPVYTDVVSPIELPSLAPNESRVFTTETDITQDRGVYSLLVTLHRIDNGQSTTDTVLRYFNGE